MTGHISLRVTGYERSRAFYVAALAPLGYTVMMEGDREPDFERGRFLTSG